MPRISIHHPAFGDILLREANRAIVSLDWASGADDAPTPLLRRAAAALAGYFAGDNLPDDLPLAPMGTDYQRRVWACLCAIPRGETRTYGAVAALAGGSARAVGGANRANPIPILIPCHRVCAAQGLGGYAGSDRAGWGLDMKRRLLQLEGAV